MLWEGGGGNRVYNITYTENQCCGAENISFGSAPALAPDGFKE